MTARFHPPAEMLMDYASGALREASSLVVATHLALCPECRREVSKCEAIGGTLLEQSEALAVSSACRSKVMAALDAQEALPAKKLAEYDPFFCNVLPAPLRNYVGCGVGQVKWQKVTSTIDKVDLSSCACSLGKARLMRIKAGAPMPEHSHKGGEYTLVLAGSFRDGDKTYTRGDFAACDDSVTHAPVATEGEDCVCLVVTEGSLKLTGLIGRMLNPFIRF